MVSFPIRLELKSDSDGLSCTFTVVDVGFRTTPAKNDVIDLTKADWPVRVLAVVQYLYHCVGDDPGAIVCCSASFANSDDMITAFEQFKTSTNIVDIDSGMRPPPYYPAYRLVTRLWGKTSFLHGDANGDGDHPSSLAELIRAACIIGLSDKSVRLNGEIELVHKLIIEDKQRRRGGSIDILTLVREWDRRTGLAQAMALADEAAVVATVADLLVGMRSIPSSKWPACISPGR